MGHACRTGPSGAFIFVFVERRSVLCACSVCRTDPDPFLHLQDPFSATLPFTLHSRRLVTDISGTDFEALTCDILASNGFELAQSTKASGDFGVDVLAYRDGISFAIQCKRYNYDVGIEAVQQVYAGRAFYECHVAMVLTNQYFTPAARKLADKIGVVLWDRDMLEELL